MRFDLKVPFAEKDAAKKLGARWDAGRKIWYVIGQEDMAAFAKWSPSAPATVGDASQAAPASGKRAAAKSATAQTEASGKVHVGSSYVEHPCVCKCLPWDVCDKCRATAFSVP